MSYQTLKAKIERLIQKTGEKYTEGYNNGKRDEYNTFWDAYQVKGTRTVYRNAFSMFNGDSFYPKYDIILSDDLYSGTQMFMGFNDNKYTKTDPVDMVERLERRGIVLDTSRATQLAHAFRGRGVSRWGTIDISSATETDSLFYNIESCKRIERLIISENTKCQTNWFSNSGGNVEYIGVEGVIANSIGFQDIFKLQPDNMKQIISCLKNYAGTENNLKYSIKFNDVCWKRLEADSVSPTGTTWAEYVEALGWLI